MKTSLNGDILALRSLSFETRLCSSLACLCAAAASSPLLIAGGVAPENTLNKWPGLREREEPIHLRERVYEKVIVTV